MIFNGLYILTLTQGIGCWKVTGEMKVKCEVCGIEGYLQTIGNYHRVRHYLNIDLITKKSKFTYHQQDKEYIDRILSNTDHLNTNIDLKLGTSSINCELEPRAGFEPATITLPR